MIYVIVILAIVGWAAFGVLLLMYNRRCIMYRVVLDVATDMAMLVGKQQEYIENLRSEQ